VRFSDDVTTKGDEAAIFKTVAGDEVVILKTIILLRKKNQKKCYYFKLKKHFHYQNFK
jgi:hypothetical protein